MLNQNKNIVPIPHIQKTRMRYRGPIESIKINNFQKALQKDIIKLNEGVAISRNNLLQYFNETLEGSSQKIEIMKDGKSAYVCEDNIPINEILSDNMTRKEFFDEEVITWDL